MIKKNDLILMGTAFFVVLIWFIINILSRKTGDYVVVTYRGEEIAKVSLKDDSEHEIQCKDKDAFRYKIEDGKVFCIYSACRDKICIKEGKIEKNGEIIVCLPQQITLSICGDEGEYDAVTD